MLGSRRRACQSASSKLTDRIGSELSSSSQPPPQTVQVQAAGRAESLHATIFFVAVEFLPDPGCVDLDVSVDMVRNKCNAANAHTMASGLHWVDVGFKPPPNTVELKHEALSNMLYRKQFIYSAVEGSRKSTDMRKRLHGLSEVYVQSHELRDLKVSNVHVDMHIRVDIRILVPAERLKIERDQKIMAMSLCQAATNGEDREVQLLLDRNVSTDVLDSTGCTALMQAVTFGHTHVVKILCAAGANTNASNQLGDACLSKAAIRGHTKCVKLLLDARANPNHMDAFGETPCMAACYNDHAGCLRLLISAAADVNAKSEDGGTALIVASYFKGQATAEVLLKAGAKKNSQDKNGMTAIRYAQSLGNKDIANMLMEGGRNVT